MRYIFTILFLVSVSAKAQQSIIREVKRAVTTFPYSDPNPVARPGRVYPYFRYDGFTNKPVSKEWKMVELENDYIRLAITPEIGGKVWEAIEKSEQYPFIFTTKAIKFRDISLRGPWTTGGLEFNFADIGHATTCFTPVDYFVRNNPDGSVSCFIGATEWASRTTWRVEIKLEPGKAYFTTRAWWYNNTPFEQEFYHWVNAGFKAGSGLEFVFPGTYHIGHGGEYDTWPLDSMGRKISFYGHNDFGSYKSYHIVGKPSGFYGGFWHADNMGFGRISPYYEKLGKKVWILGLSQEGERWENLLGDSDGLNVELQSGRLFNQASKGSERTPFKHVGFAPYASDTWTDYWFPVKHTRGMTHATTTAAMNLRTEDGWLKIDFMPLEFKSDSLKVLSGEKLIMGHKVELNPMEVLRDSVKWTGNAADLCVTIGNDIITDERISALGRPVESPADFNWDSEYGLWLMGADLARQKDYPGAGEYFGKALAKNPDMVPALTGMAELMARKGNYEKAKEYARKALAVDTYDPASNFIWGLSGEMTGNDADAFDGYSVAALSPVTRNAAWIRLAQLAGRKGRWNEALNVISKNTENYPSDPRAQNIRLLSERKTGNLKAALAHIEELVTTDPLNHMARFEKFMITGKQEDRDAFTGMIRQELPHETYIELALLYHEMNLDMEALEILDASPEHPMVRVWQAYLMDKGGNKSESEQKLMLALNSSPDLVFPFRPEMIQVFRWADELRPSWKWKYYEALIHWQNNDNGKAKELFASCGSEPGFVPFWMAKAELFGDDPSTAGKSLEKAYKMDPASWRTASALARFYSRQERKTEALKVAAANYKAHSGSFIVGLQYAQMLRLNRKYEECLNVLGKLEMLPAEGDVNAHTLFREANIMYALEQMKSGKWKKALASLKKAEEWPENLFSGEPYFADNRITKYISAYCSERLKDTNSAGKFLAYIKDYKNPDGWPSRSGNELTSLLNSGENNYRSVTGRLVEKCDGDRDKEVLEELLTIFR